MMKMMKMKQITARVLGVFGACAFLLTVSGCAVTFTENDALQFSLSEPTEQVVSIVAEFEAGEADNAAGDVTQKTGSVCAGGACIIY